MIGKDTGNVVQFVDTDYIAQHVGPRANEIFIGIEFESILARPQFKNSTDPPVNVDPLTPFQIQTGRGLSNGSPECIISRKLVLQLCRHCIGAEANGRGSLVTQMLPAVDFFLPAMGMLCSEGILWLLESCPGNCWDNAVVESFFAKLKTELRVTKEVYATRQAARTAIF